NSQQCIDRSWVTRACVVGVLAGGCAPFRYGAKEAYRGWRLEAAAGAADGARPRALHRRKPFGKAASARAAVPGDRRPGGGRPLGGGAGRSRRAARRARGGEPVARWV